MSITSWHLWLHLGKPDGSISSRIDLTGCPYAWAPFVNSCSIIPCPSHLKSRVDSNVVSCLAVLESVQCQTAGKGAQIRSRIKWAVDGEQSTSYFLRLEKKNSSDSWIAAVTFAMSVHCVTEIDMRKSH